MERASRARVQQHARSRIEFDVHRHMQGKGNASHEISRVRRYAAGLAKKFLQKSAVPIRTQHHAVASKTPRVAKKPPLAHASAILVVPKALFIDHLTRVVRVALRLRQQIAAQN
jgi:hypothetical protein